MEALRTYSFFNKIVEAAEPVNPFNDRTDVVKENLHTPTYRPFTRELIFVNHTGSDECIKFLPMNYLVVSYLHT